MSPKLYADSLSSKKIYYGGVLWKRNVMMVLGGSFPVLRKGVSFVRLLLCDA